MSGVPSEMGFAFRNANFTGQAGVGDFVKYRLGDNYGCIWNPAVIKCLSAVITFSIPNSHINMKLVQSVNEKN